MSITGRNSTPADASFGVDSSRIVHETIDGETILIDLRTGTYYSLTGSGPEIWALLAAGVSPDRAAKALGRRYPAQAGEAAGAARKMLDELLEEGLLVRSPNGSAAEEPSLPPPALESISFEAPVLQRFTDMEYFLLLDPVHEVDESAGWPGPAREDDG